MKDKTGGQEVPLCLYASVQKRAVHKASGQLFYVV